CAAAPHGARKPRAARTPGKTQRARPRGGRARPRNPQSAQFDQARLFTQRRLLGERSGGVEDNQFIQSGVDRLEGIVQGALQFARPAAPAFEPVSVTQAFKSLGELVEPALKKSDIKLITDFQTDTEVSVDPGQLKQALLNLVNNAADSIRRDGV